MMNMYRFDIESFPPTDIDSDVDILKKLVDARAKLNGLDKLQHALPNPELIINTLPLQEARDSSAIENIVTTNDQVYKYRLEERRIPPAMKEVREYVRGLSQAISQMKYEKNLITINNIKNTQRIVIGNDAGFRSQKGTSIKDANANKIIYTPPQDAETIKKLTANLVTYINTGNNYDPLIRMALIHHQFESIHPFYDGNGRTGRILNLVFLIKEELLSQPILYLSRFINHNRKNYYELLQSVRDDGKWKEWVIFILIGIADTAEHTANLILEIKNQFEEHKEIIRKKYKSFYSHELINHIYANPYTKIKYLQEDLRVSRLTASKYLKILANGGVLTLLEEGKDKYYINHKLTKILFEAPSLALREADRDEFENRQIMETNFTPTNK